MAFDADAFATMWTIAWALSMLAAFAMAQVLFTNVDVRTFLMATVIATVAKSMRWVIVEAVAIRTITTMAFVTMKNCLVAPMRMPWTTIQMPQMTMARAFRLASKSTPMSLTGTETITFQSLTS